MRFFFWSIFLIKRHIFFEHKYLQINFIFVYKKCLNPGELNEELRYEFTVVGQNILSVQLKKELKREVLGKKTIKNNSNQRLLSIFIDFYFFFQILI